MARTRSSEPESALYVRLPQNALDKLDRAAGALGVAKKDLVAGLVSKYVDPDSRRGLNVLGVLSERRTLAAGDGSPVPGSYSFRPYELPPEVLNAAQAAELLQLDEKVVITLAQAAEIPGRKLGKVWRFSRTALVAWLSATPKR